MNGLAEISPEEPAEPVSVLDDQRKIQAQFVAQRLQRLGRRLDSQDDLGRVARDHPQNKEDHARNQEKRGDENEDAFAEKSEH